MLDSPVITSNTTESHYSFWFSWWSALKAWLIGVLIGALKRSGPIPAHVALIMDGNRRFAKRNRLPRASSGHFEGARTLERVRREEIELFIIL